MGLEIQTGKTPGTVVRTTPAPRPAIVGGMILALFVIQLLFFGLICAALWEDWRQGDDTGRVGADGKPILYPGANNAAAHDPAIPDTTISILGFKDVTFFKNEQTIVSFWIAMTFFCLFFMIFLYQRFFKDHVTIVKKRFRKWEDEGVQLHA